MDSFSMVAAKGFYQFKINHTKTKHLGIGECITSPKFRVGQHDWTIMYYPQGTKKDNSGKYISVFLVLQRESVDVRAAFVFSLLDKHENLQSYAMKEMSHTFTMSEVALGLPRFFGRIKLEETYVQDDYFVLGVKITIKDELCTGERWYTGSDSFLHERLQQFKKENKCTDVSFDVDGKNFVAHRLILAAHSPVFEAELFGSMAESYQECITISEMIPSVFKAMLDFMYNDSLTVNEEPIDYEWPMSSATFFQHLLAAADRYAVEKLKTICEYELAKSISLDTVLSTLELAEKHNCSELKKDCLQFIVDKNNSVSLMLSEEYIRLMLNYPTLLVELKDLIGK